MYINNIKYIFKEISEYRKSSINNGVYSLDITFDINIYKEYEKIFFGMYKNNIILNIDCKKITANYANITSISIDVINMILTIKTKLDIKHISKYRNETINNLLK
ncbi:MAG: hypothetical protein M0R46_13295 [Candidatus Muirbacterium halophilum]|nr:hypothetical protein [Candidatus Muirbacterium halophilum]